MTLRTMDEIRANYIESYGALVALTLVYDRLTAEVLAEIDRHPSHSVYFLNLSGEFLTAVRAGVPNRIATTARPLVPPVVEFVPATEWDRTLRQCATAQQRIAALEKEATEAALTSLRRAAADVHHWSEFNAPYQETKT